MVGRRDPHVRSGSRPGSSSSRSQRLRVRLPISHDSGRAREDLDGAAHKLQELGDAGVSVPIDDFGTGYTSLAHLRTLPIDILKIDRSFTCDPNASSLVQLIIDTGHLLGVRITAEGVETVAQATSLTRMGADELQGYLYARPMPAEHLQLLPGINAGPIRGRVDAQRPPTPAEHPTPRQGSPTPR